MSNLAASAAATADQLGQRFPVQEFNMSFVPIAGQPAKSYRFHRHVYLFLNYKDTPKTYTVKYPFFLIDVSMV